MQDCHDQTASHCSHRVLVGLETSDAQERQCMSCCSKECKYTNLGCKYVQIYVFISVCLHAHIHVPWHLAVGCSLQAATRITAAEVRSSLFLFQPLRV